jgi:Flp pilus assembly protein, pilin Flp
MLAGMVKAFITDESGATAIEYALIGTLIAVALVGTVTVFGDALGNLFNNGVTDVLDTQAAKIP